MHRYGRGKLLFARVLSAPFVILLSFVMAVCGYHYFKVEQARAQIRAYIYSRQSPLVEPEFRLHFIYRPICGNAMLEQMQELYSAAAATGFDDPDPQVRARARQASLAVSGIGWNGYPDGLLRQVIEHAERDSDPTVQKILAPYREYYTED